MAGPIFPRLLPLVSGTRSHTKTSPAKQMAEYSQNTPAAPSIRFRGGKVKVRMKQAIQTAETATETVPDQIRGAHREAADGAQRQHQNRQARRPRAEQVAEHQVTIEQTRLMAPVAMFTVDRIASPLMLGHGSQLSPASGGSPGRTGWPRKSRPAAR